MANSHLFPRKEVVCARTVMRASSSSSGKSVSSRHGRTFAAMPKSTVQISPRRASGIRGILSFHLIKQRKSFARGLVAENNILGFRLHLDDFPAQIAPLMMSQLGQFFDDFSHAHTLLVNA